MRSIAIILAALSLASPAAARSHRFVVCECGCWYRVSAPPRMAKELSPHEYREMARVFFPGIGR